MEGAPIPPLSATTTLLSRRTDWRAALERQVTRDPLIDTAASRAGLRAGGERPLRTIFLGVGLCARDRLSAALPIDVLGMLLPAERIRRATGAERLTILVADEHAKKSGLAAAKVAVAADRTVATLEAIRKILGRPPWEILRATQIAATPAYQSILAHVIARSRPSDRPYFTHQAADLAYMARRDGAVCKIGWSIGGDDDAGRRDEVAFDRRSVALLGRSTPFVYCLPGRTLDDRRRKAAPYIAREPERRVCLEPGEQVRCKLERAGATCSEETVRGYRRHLKRITRAAVQLGVPLDAGVEQRAQKLVSEITRVRASLS